MDDDENKVINPVFLIHQKRKHKEELRRAREKRRQHSSTNARLLREAEMAERNKSNPLSPRKRKGGKSSSRAGGAKESSREDAPLWTTLRASLGYSYLDDTNLGEVSLWLRALKLPEGYLENFVLEGFDDMDSIKLLVIPSDWESIGITKDSHIQKMSRWISSHRPKGYHSIFSEHSEEEDELSIDDEQSNRMARE